MMLTSEERSAKARASAETRWADERTACEQGHGFTPENTIIRKDGSRKCRTCTRASTAKWKRENREKVRAHRRAWRESNPGASNSSVKAWRSKHPEQCRAYSQARRSRLKGGETEQFTDLEIFERDEWICGICHHPIDPLLRHPNPDSVSLDHIVPVSDGGAHTRANTQASHLLCNMIKGNRGCD